MEIDSLADMVITYCQICLRSIILITIGL